MADLRKAVTGEATQYSITDDALPLHPRFWEYIQEDEQGLFVQVGENRFAVGFGRDTPPAHVSRNCS